MRCFSWEENGVNDIMILCILLCLVIVGENIFIYFFLFVKIRNLRKGGWLK